MFDPQGAVYSPRPSPMACEADCEITRRRQNLAEDWIAAGMLATVRAQKPRLAARIAFSWRRALLAPAGRGQHEAGDEKPLLCSWKHACELPESLLPFERVRAT